MKTVIKNGDVDLMEVFDRDVIEFLARRHDTSIKKIVSQFLKQSHIENQDNTEYGFLLEPNEVEILRDYYLRGVSVP